MACVSLTNLPALHCAAPRLYRVNSLHPGTFTTPMVFWCTGLPVDMAQALQADIVNRRTARPTRALAEEIAPALVFMASDESCYMTALNWSLTADCPAR